MPAFLIVHSTVTNPEKFQEYVTASEESLKIYQGDFLLGGMVSEILEGNHDKARTVIFRFPSTELAKQWYDSDEYRSVKHLRENTGEFDFVLVDSF